MSEEKVERKVAVIFATDVVGYSTKIEHNETQTLQTLRPAGRSFKNSSASIRAGSSTLLGTRYLQSFQVL